MDQAATALGGPMEQVSNGTLIQGIEDIGGDEGTAIAHAVPIEAALVSQALLAANVRDSETVERVPLSPGQDYTAFKPG